MDNTHLPVAVIGAGPVGLAAAAHLLGRGLTPLVLEAGADAGASVREWAHVRFFSPWRYAIDAAARALLEAHGWTVPDPEGYPTGQDLLDRYLAPLAALPEIAPHLRTGSRVLSVTRRGVDKMKTRGREDAPFVLRVRGTDGREEAILARAVIDASGTWTMPNPLGADGVPAIGERALAQRIHYGIPDVLGADRARYAGRRVLVVGSGHSAFNALQDLAELARQEPGTAITWAIRRATLGQVFGGGADDELAERGALGRRIRELVEAGTLRVAMGFKLTALRDTPDGIVVPARRATSGRWTRSSPPPASARTSPSWASCGWASTRIREPDGPGPADRPEPAQLRHGGPARGGRAGAPGAGLLHRGDEELRAGPDLPAADRLRAGPLGGGGPGRRLGGGARRAPGAARDRGLLVRPGWRLLLRRAGCPGPDRADPAGPRARARAGAGGGRPPHPRRRAPDRGRGRGAGSLLRAIGAGGVLCALREGRVLRRCRRGDLRLPVSGSAVGTARREGTARPRYYGWVLVATLGITTIISYGTSYYLFGVLVVPLGRDPGWGRGAVSGAYALGVVLAGLLGVPIGRLVDRRGARLPMAAGSAVGGLSLLGLSGVHALWQFYLLWSGGLGLAGALTFYPVSFTVVANWFDRRRGAALALLTLLGGLASPIFVPLAGALVPRLGWRETVAILGLVQLCVALPLHALVVRRHPEDLGLQPDGLATEGSAHPLPVAGLGVRAALRLRAFWTLTLAFALATLAGSVLLVHAVAYLIGRGYGGATAAAFAGAVGLASLPGRLGLNLLSDRVGPQPLLALCLAAEAAGRSCCCTPRPPAGSWPTWWCTGPPTAPSRRSAPP